MRKDKLADLSKMLRRERLRRDLGVRETARLLKISPTTITNIENGKDFHVSILLDLMGLFLTTGKSR